MPILYTITASTQTITAYVNETMKGPEAFRLNATRKESASGTLRRSDLLQCSKGGATGWVDVRKGTLTQSGVIDPPPTDPPPATLPDIDVQVTQSALGSAVHITISDESKPINVILNGHIVWTLPASAVTSG